MMPLPKYGIEDANFCVPKTANTSVYSLPLLPLPLFLLFSLVFLQLFTFRIPRFTRFIFFFSSIFIPSRFLFFFSLTNFSVIPLSFQSLLSIFLYLLLIFALSSVIVFFFYFLFLGAFAKL